MPLTPTYDVHVLIGDDSDSVLSAGEMLTIEVWFHEPVVEPYLTFSEIGWPSSLQPFSPWGAIYGDQNILGATIFLTALPNITSTDNYITVDGVPLMGYPFSIDTAAPVVTDITLSDTHLTTGESMLVTVNFSEAIAGFTEADMDLSMAPGSLSGFQQVDAMTYTMVFTPVPDTVDMTNSMTVMSGGYTDLPVNLGVTGATSANFSIDTTAQNPVVPQPSIFLNTMLVGQAGVEFTVLFDEPVQNFTLDDVAIVGATGTFTQLTSQPGGLEYQISFVPDSGQVSPSNQFVVLAGGYQDLDGNAGLAGASASFMIDSDSPYGFGLPLSDSMIAAGEQLVMTLQFSEPVIGLDIEDFDITQAAVQLSALTDEGGGLYTAVFTPLPGAELDVNHIEVAAGQYTDQAGNPGFPLILPEFSVDTLAPVIQVAQNDAMLVSGEVLDLTIAFSEPVTGFDINDIDASGAAGTLGELSYLGNDSYSLQFTPAPGTTVSDNIIVIRGEYTDAAGNAGVDWMSNAFSIDTIAPSLSIGISHTALAAGDSQTITFSFSEMVADFTADDILLDGAATTLSSFVAEPDGQTFTATYQPASGVIDPFNEFSVAAGSYTDLPGNAGDGAVSANFGIDTSGLVIFGTAGNDTLLGGDGDDRLMGVPATGTALGKGSVDQLTGGGGADQFFLADPRGIFYIDGNNKTNGTKDYAWITDFSHSEGDQLVVGDGNYFFATMKVGKTSGTSLCLDTNGNNSWDAKDEVIAFIAGVPAGSMSVAADLVHF